MTYLIPRNFFATPFGHLDDWTKELGKTFDDLIERNATHRACDVMENAENYEVHIEVPGLTKDNIDIEFIDNTLTIRTHMETKEEDPEWKNHRLERIHKEGLREFRFPNDINHTDIEAKCENGLLKVTLPKAEEKKAQKIAIEAVGD